MNRSLLKHFSTSLLLSVTLISSLTVSGFANELSKHEELDTTSPIEISVLGRYISEADFDDNNASYSFTEYGARLDWNMLSLTYVGRQYSWNDVNTAKFANSDDGLWDELHNLKLELNFDGMFNDTWGWFVSPSISSTFEKEMSSSFTTGLQGGLLYSFNENWNLILGADVALASHGEFSVNPIALVNYKNENELGLSATLGFPFTSVNYRFNENIALRTSVDMGTVEYRLADDNILASEGYLEKQEVIIGFYADITPNISNFENLEISAGVEYNTMREINVYNKNYNKIQSIDVDDAFGASLRFKYSF